MQTTYSVNPGFAVEGMRHGGARRSVPAMLAWLAQIDLLTVTAGSATDDLVITVVDDQTGQEYEATATGSATESTLLTNALAAIRASEINKLFSVEGEVDTNILITFTARHANRTYTISATGGTNASTAPAVTSVQAAGGTGIEFGRFVARGDDPDTFRALAATDTIEDVLGVLTRTDANHFHSLESDTPDAVDRSVRGRHYPIDQEVYFWAKPETSLTTGGALYLRIAQTSSAGRVGALRSSPAGATQVATITPAENHGSYAIAYGYLGEHYKATYNPTDATTTVADACAGLEDAADENAPSGVTVSAGGTTAITLTAAAGTKFDYVHNVAWNLDTEAASTTVSVAAADVDALDISSIARIERGAAQDGLALIRVRKVL